MLPKAPHSFTHYYCLKHCNFLAGLINMAAKRPCVIEGNTPGKPACKRQPCEKSRRCLFASNKESEPTGKSDWTVREKSALVQYICLFWKDSWTDKWQQTMPANLTEQVCNLYLSQFFHINKINYTSYLQPYFRHTYRMYMFLSFIL